MTRTNDQRASAAADALDHYAEANCLYVEGDTPEVLRDLLTDLRHFCNQSRFDFDAAVRMSAMHFEAEGED